jgi:5-methylcytosine-specific restriction endonuclease McrA
MEQHTRKRGTDSDGHYFSDERVQEVWDKGHRVHGKDPEIYRRDDEGNVLHRYSYGKDGPMSWEVDHSNPVSRGGSDNLRNLRPLQTDENREKGSKYPY